MAYKHPDHEDQLQAMVAWAASRETPELRADAAQSLMKTMYAAYQDVATVRRSGFRELRAAGLTHAELAEMFEVSKSRVDQILNY